MRVCPQCARKNKPRAKFCDRCGFEFVGFAGNAISTQRAEAPEELLPPNDTAKGIPPSQAGVPEAVRDPKGIYRQTQKLNAPVVAAGAPDETAVVEQTVKVASKPAGGRAGSGPQPTDDPEPDATIQGAFYLRKQSADASPSADQHVGWLAAPTMSPQTPGAIWPVTAGLTYIGSDVTLVGTGVLANRPGLEPLHALLFHRDGDTWLVDLATSTGSIVNGDRLRPLQGRQLGERDEIRLGELVLSFRCVDPQSPPGP